MKPGMRQAAWWVVIAGLVVGVAAYAYVYLAKTSVQREVARNARPTLAWLKEEFQLSDAQFARLCELHDAYRPRCLEMCRRIAAKNAEIEGLLAATNAVTSRVRQALGEAAEIRAECEAAMLEHFFQVARTMPPAQGRRYLAWVQGETLKTRQMMPGDPGAHSMPGMR